MKVEGILTAKGRAVETTRPEATVRTAIRRLTTMGIGALVVSAGGERVDGVISERDVVRGLDKHGAALLDMRVTDVMSRSVPICSPNDSIKHVMAQMTRTRNRHLPVVDGG
ncbi:MAG: CBS domain-containing protein, partial [Pseudonocardiaceae bacterium]